MALRAYKYRFYPTTEQKINLAQSFGCARKIYNHFLDFNNTEYKKENKSGYLEWSRELTKLKIELVFLKEVSSVVLQQSLRNLDKAFKNFFKGHNKFPKFKRKFGRNSISYTKSGFKYVDGKITLAKQKKPLNIRWSRELKGEISSLTISMTPTSKYFISMLVDEQIDELPKIKKEVGIDLGLSNFLVTSDGLKIINQNFARKYQEKLAIQQKIFARCKRDSNRRIKQNKKVAIIHEKITNSRNDFLHKVSTTLINENQVICVEDLAVKNMVKNNKLSKSISDVSWGSFVAMLDYKAEWYGRTIKKTDRWFPSSKTCSCCGEKIEKLPLNIRNWKCSECGSEHDRDINAAINILNEGLAGHVRHVKCASNSTPIFVGELAKGNILNNIVGRVESPSKRVFG